MLERALPLESRVLLARDILLQGKKKAVRNWIKQLTEGFPYLAKSFSGMIMLSFNFEDSKVNIFQENDMDILHVNADKLKGIKNFVAKRMLEDGMLIEDIEVAKKPKFFHMRFYKAYRIINEEGYQLPLCYN